MDVWINARMANASVSCVRLKNKVCWYNKYLIYEPNANVYHPIVLCSLSCWSEAWPAYKVTAQMIQDQTLKISSYIKFMLAGNELVKFNFGGLSTQLGDIDIPNPHTFKEWCLSLNLYHLQQKCIIFSQGSQAAIDISWYWTSTNT